MEKTVDLKTAQYKNIIDDYLNRQCFIYPSEPQQKLFEAMRYSLMAGGKRLRPIFVLEFCRLCSGTWEQALPFAAAIEMIQTYSLIHDDLPCMDDDDFRRGIPTNHKVYGESTAVLAGDALLTEAFHHIATAPLSAEQRIQAVEILSFCAGALGMVGGQVLDIEGESKQCTEEDILAIHSRKTGALIVAACKLGVIAGNGNDAQISAAEEFARNLGLAFQIRDDMLDVIGSAAEMGKATGTDTDKNTFVQLYGLQKCEELVARYTSGAISALNCFTDIQYLTDLSNNLTNRTY